MPGGGAGGCGGGGGVGVEGAAPHQQEHQTLRGQARPTRRRQGGSFDDTTTNLREVFTIMENLLRHYAKQATKAW